MEQQLSKNFNNCIKYGVTTIRDVAAFPKKINQWRKKIESGRSPGPRVIPTNSFNTSTNGVPEMAPKLNFLESFIAGGQFAERITTPAEAKRVANRMLDQGATWLKTQYSEESFLFHGKLENLSDDCFMAIRQTASQRGARMAMHHTEAAGLRKGVQIGVDSLEHCAVDPLEEKDVDAFVKSGTSIIPTLKIYSDSLEVETLLNWLHQDGKNDFMPEPLRQSIRELEVLFQKPYPPSGYMKKLALVIVSASTMSFRHAFSRNLCSE